MIFCTRKDEMRAVPERTGGSGEKRFSAASSKCVLVYGNSEENFSP